MTDDSLTRLRAINPVAGDVPPPSIALVSARIAADRGRSGAAPAGPATAPSAGPGRVRAILAHGLVPALGVTVALAVAVVALILVGHGVHPHRVAAGHRSTHGAARGAASHPSAPQVTLPRGGMPGVVQLWGSALSSSGAGFVSFEQCNPCDSTQRFAEWSVITRDSGARWTLVPRSFYLFDPQFGGARDVWADGQNRGAIVNAVWVSHDSGRRWTRANLMAPTNEPGSASAAGGEAWAAAPQCGSGCQTTILHGAATGGTLTPTRDQPVPRSTQTRVIAAGAGSAYLEVTAGRAARHYVTHDDGRSWQATTSACRSGFLDAAVAADGPASLWEQCVAAHEQVVIARSTDSGHHWTRHPMPFGGLAHLLPVGGGVAWGITDAGLVIRTTDSGTSWQAVLHAAGPASLLAGSAQTALVVRTAGRGHVHHHAADTNLIAYRTTDGGTHWTSSAIALAR